VGDRAGTCTSLSRSPSWCQEPQCLYPPAGRVGRRRRGAASHAVDRPRVRGGGHGPGRLPGQGPAPRAAAAAVPGHLRQRGAGLRRRDRRLRAGPLPVGRPALPPGRLPFVDVRDVAALHAAVLRQGQGARRYLLAGPAVEMVELAGLLGELTGRRLPQRTAPEWLLRAGSRLLDRVQRLVPVRLPISAEAVASTLGIGADVAVDDAAARQELASSGASCARPWLTPCAGWRSRGRSRPGRSVPWPADRPTAHWATAPGRGSQPSPANLPPPTRQPTFSNRELTGFQP
jgi:hypothetical protein